MKKFKVSSLLVIALLFISSISQAASFNFPNINYNSLYNLANSRGYTISYGNNGSSNNSTPRNNSNTNVVPTYNNSRYGIVIPSFNWNNWSRPSTPTVPTQPTQPTQPTEPTKPTTPTQPTKPTQPTQPTQPSTPVAGMTADEMEVVRLVNIEREKAGLKPLKASSELSRVARAKSEDMGRNGYFSHTSPTYGSPFDMMKQFGIRYSTAGENIARGYLSPQSVVNGWMNSSGHRANIMNPSFGTIGVGAYKTSNNTTYWTQMFTN